MTDYEQVKQYCARIDRMLTEYERRRRMDWLAPLTGMLVGTGLFTAGAAIGAILARAQGVLLP